MSLGFLRFVIVLHKLMRKMTTGLTKIETHAL